MDVPLRSVVEGYLQHLTDADLALLAETRALAGTGSKDVSSLRRILRQEPRRLLEALGDPSLAQLVLGPQPAAPEDGPPASRPGDPPGQALPLGAEPFAACSPFAVFAVALEQVAQSLQRASFTWEWLGPRHRAPVFDVEPLRQLLADPAHRLFLAELLASYTHVASGAVWVATRRGLRRRRFSELDPVRMAELVALAPPAERPGVLRRLGDLALFSTGVFPDAVARRGFSPLDAERLARLTGARLGDTANAPTLAGLPGMGDASAVALLEEIGRRAYRAALASVPEPLTRSLRVLATVADRFDDARRVLATVTDRYLFPHRDRWFGLAG
ncbi:hypothetical protein ACFFRE_01995 [Aciditerrimonas ferrireducens]|jgi:hypothetical protein|uniref:Uncharacterized protein n=1 Tax=Aciditerrimonas ferrireducens TaxID=667306 RepID=A0ABV6BZS4_9ACTN